MKYRCPVCMFSEMPYPPADYDICPCCGTEFGNDDAELSHSALLKNWVAADAPWFFGAPPANWNPWLQLIEGGKPEAIPFAVILKATADMQIQSSPSIGNAPGIGGDYWTLTASVV
jgi:hypothetical protein